MFKHPLLNRQPYRFLTWYIWIRKNFLALFRRKKGGPELIFFSGEHAAEDCFKSVVFFTVKRFLKSRDRRFH